MCYGLAWCNCKLQERSSSGIRARLRSSHGKHEDGVEDGENGQTEDRKDVSEIRDSLELMMNYMEDMKTYMVKMSNGKATEFEGSNQKMEMMV